MVIKEALSWVDRTSWRQVTIESDCLTVVQAIEGSYPMRSHFGQLVEECRLHMQRLKNISLFFVKRSANTVAHKLARESYVYSCRVFGRRSVPIEIQ